MRSTLSVGGSITCMVKFTSLRMCICNRGTEQGEAGVAPARASELLPDARVWRLATTTSGGLIPARLPLKGTTPVAAVPAFAAGEFCESIELTIDCQPGTIAFEAGDCAQSVAAIASSRSRILIQKAPGSVYRAALQGHLSTPARSTRDRPFALPPHPRYREAMAEASRIDFENPAPIDADEDEETLAAIDEGIRDAKAGRSVPMEEVRGLLPEWITASSLRKER
jgi:predicted transcriptional regulator